MDANTGQPLDPNVRASPSSVHTDIRRDKDGNMVMVRHRSKNGSLVRGNEKIIFKDVKKNKNNNGGAKDKNDDGLAFTAEEDAKLKELKGDGTTWKNIAAEMNRELDDLKTRWKQIDGNAGSGGNQKDGSGEKANQGGGKDKKSGGGDFSKEEDDKVRALLASNTNFKNIAKELGRSLDKPLREHIAKLKEETGGDNAKNEQGENKSSDNITKKDKQKIRELLKANLNTAYKDIAKALDRNIDQTLKDEIGKIKAELGDAGKDESGGKEKGKNKSGGNDDKKEGKEKDKEKDKEKAKIKEAEKPASIAPTPRSEVRFTMEEWRMLQEDEFFTFGELQLISEIIMKHPGRSWLSVASRFHDKTGRRVHPDDIRDKFDQMATMGR